MSDNRRFRLKADLPGRDQPQAIGALVEGLRQNRRYQTLLGYRLG